MSENENNERKFIHDIATPLATALFLTEMLLENIKSRPDAAPEDLSSLRKIHEVVGKMKKIPP